MKLLKPTICLVILFLAPLASAVEFHSAATCVPSNPNQAVAYSQYGEVTSDFNGMFATVRCAIPRVGIKGNSVSVGVYVQSDAAYEFACSLSTKLPMTTNTQTVSGSTSKQGNQFFSVMLHNLNARDMLTLSCAVPPLSKLYGFSYREF